MAEAKTVNDVWIAACCLVRELPLATFNAKDFLDFAESLGYLERRDDPDDQRSKRVHLTPRGHAAMAMIRAAVSALEGEWPSSSAPRTSSCSGRC